MNSPRDLNVRRSLAVVLIAGLASLAMVACTEDSDPSAGSSVAVTSAAATTTVAVSTTVATTSSPTTTPDTTLPSTTLESTTTTEPPPPGWTPVDSLPSLAYLPCCASNWSGVRSPAIPDDPALGLLPGMYYAHRVATDRPSTRTITFEVSRFEACTALPEGSCEDGPYGPEDMGIVEPPERGFTLPLDATIKVGVSGNNCEPDQRLATGAELGPLMAAFDQSYKQLLGGPFNEGDDPDVLVQSLAGTPSGGFSAPDCQMGGNPLVWRGDDGPAILLQSAFAFDGQTNETVAPASASAEWLRLTAIEIAPDGTPTLYFFAGFYS
jgi:hypothetical protein